MSLMTFSIYVTIFVILIYHKLTLMNFLALLWTQSTQFNSSLKLGINTEMSASVLLSLCVFFFFGGPQYCDAGYAR